MGRDALGDQAAGPGGRGKLDEESDTHHGGGPTGTATGTDNEPEKVAVESGAEVVGLPAKSSEPYWDRTSDPLLKRQLLYH